MISFGDSDVFSFGIFGLIDSSALFCRKTGPVADSTFFAAALPKILLAEMIALNNSIKLDVCMRV